MNLREHSPPLSFRPEDARARQTGKPVVRIIEGIRRSFAWIFLPSGLQVMAPLRRLPIVHAAVAVRQGAYHEEKPGTAHALEHLVCKDVHVPGTHPALASLIRHGLHTNAFTQGELTCYWGLIPFHNWRGLLNGLLTMVFQAQPLIDHSRWKKERPAILEESLRQRTENTRIAIAMRTAAYPAFERFRHPIDGTVEDIERLTVDDLIEAYWMAYHPNNAVIIVEGFGRVEPLLHWLETRPEAHDHSNPHARIAFGPFKERGRKDDLLVPVSGPPSMERVQYVSGTFSNSDLNWRSSWLLVEIMNNGLLGETFRRQHGLVYHFGMTNEHGFDGQRHFEVGGRMGRANMNAAREIWDGLWKDACCRLPKQPADLRPFLDAAIGAHALQRAKARLQIPQQMRDPLLKRWLTQSRNQAPRDALDWNTAELLSTMKRFPTFADLPWQEIRILPTP